MKAAQNNWMVLERLAVGHTTTPLWPAVTMSIQPKQLWAFVGPNGSGKSTLLQTIVGLLPSLDGRVVTASGLRIAYVSQQRVLPRDMPWRVNDCVQGGTLVGQGHNAWWRPHKKARRQACHEALAMMGLTDFASRCVGQLSEGQRQRVVLARALACRPNIIVLDEPTSAMDLKTEAQSLKALKKLTCETELSVIMVGHHIEALLASATHVALLGNVHKAVEFGPTTHMMQTILRAMRPNLTEDCV